MGNGDTVGITSYLSDEKENSVKGTNRAEMSTDWLQLTIYLYQYSSLYQVKQLSQQELLTDWLYHNLNLQKYLDDET